MEHPISENVAAFRIRAELRLIERDKGEVPLHRHRFGRAEEPPGVLGEDLLLAGDQRDLARPLDLHHPVVDLSRQEAKRKAHHSARMGAHALDREVGLARVCRPEDGRQRRPGEITHCR
jgi:hypothetical protein